MVQLFGDFEGQLKSSMMIPVNKTSGLQVIGLYDFLLMVCNL